MVTAVEMGYTTRRNIKPLDHNLHARRKSTGLIKSHRTALMRGSSVALNSAALPSCVSRSFRCVRWCSGALRTSSCCTVPYTTVDSLFSTGATMSSGASLDSTKLGSSTTVTGGATAAGGAAWAMTAVVWR